MREIYAVRKREEKREKRKMGGGLNLLFFCVSNETEGRNFARKAARPTPD